MSDEERGEWLRSSRLLREWGWSSRWDGPGCGWGWEEAAGGGYSIMQAQAEARGREQALARGGSGGPLRARVEGNAQVTLAQAQAQARALVVAQAVAQAGEHTDRLYQAQTWAQARGQAECRRVMADRTRAQIQAKAQGMTVSQGQVAGQGYTVAQAKVSMHMVGVAAKVEAMVAEQGGVETAEVQNVLRKVEADMVVECFVIYMAAHGMDVWAVGGTYKWEHDGGDGYGAGPLDAGVFFDGKWMMTQSEIYASDGNYDTG